MPNITNCFTFDWRDGPDKTFFFWPNLNLYTRFDNGRDRTDSGYPKPIIGNWEGFGPNGYVKDIKELRFAFTFSTDLANDTILFFRDKAGTPELLYYSPERDSLSGYEDLTKSRWKKITPYFYQIVFAVWWRERPGNGVVIFWLNNGKYLRYTVDSDHLEVKNINGNWPGLEQYQTDVLTGVQWNRSPSNDWLFVFLKGNRYIKYDIDADKTIGGPWRVDETTWPGVV
ncbi:hypothetical protein [Pseudomonas izuensis]|uniref:hypothetical protein n=1 Tax=Pseudomonas izuensis TaxID=2684212 RepID=UPI0013594B3A|nr:hypothetical protein [Pseudomonas izuensis]